MSKKLTPWFPGDVKPVRAGVYETDSEQIGGTRTFQRWTGKQWGLCTSDASFAPPFMSAYQNPKWRGLAKKP